MPRVACPDRAELSAYVLGKLPDEGAQRLAQHAAGCTQCQAALLGLDTLSDGLIAHVRQPRPRDTTPEPALQRFLHRAEAIAMQPGPPAGQTAAGAQVVPVPQFLQCLADSALFAPDEVKGILAGVQPAVRQDTRQLAQELIKQGKLTRFQASMLCVGKSKGLVVGRYVILDKIGAGGMGMVYKARQKGMGRIVALKVLAPAVSKNPAAVQRFQREVRVAAQLTHENIVRAFDADQADGLFFLVMEFVDGADLSGRVKQHGPLPVGQAVECLRQAACGLAHAHAAGIVHRDIKPHNLLLDSKGIVRVLDMGLARIDGTGNTVGSVGDLTDTHSIMGTCDYMAPEQAINTKKADQRADIYSLGCTLYFLLAGKPMYAGETQMEKLMAHQHDPIPPLPGASTKLQAVYQRMVAKKIEDRYQSMAEVIADLQTCGPAAVQDVRIAALPGTGRGTGLKASPAGALSETATYAPQQGTDTEMGQRPRRPGRRWVIVGGGAVVGMAVLGGVLALLGGRKPSINPTSEIPARAISYQGDFQGPQPAAGWQYLWNQKGPIGIPTNYVPLLWNGKGDYNSIGKPLLQGPPPGSFVFLGTKGPNAGHPGDGSAQTKGIDYFAIAAYTIQASDGPGWYSLTGSSIQPRDAKSNGLEVLVHVNSNLPLKRTVIAPNQAGTFDTSLGSLRQGDTIYVAVGPNADAENDVFGDFNFKIRREAGPGPPPTKPVSGEADLLKLVNVPKPTPGDWHFEGATLISPPGGQPARVPIRYEPPEEYMLTIVAERLSGDNGLFVFLVHAGTRFHIAFDTWGGKASGLGMLDGKWEADNETAYRKPLMQTGKPRTITCTVRKTGVTVTCDDATIVHWQGDYKRLSNPDVTGRDLYLGTYQSSFRFTKITLSPLATAKQPETLPAEYTNGLGMQFVRVPKGKALLGGGGGKLGTKEFEVKQDFYLGKYEVTQSEWEAITGANPSRHGPRSKDLANIPREDIKRFPVENVSWDDAKLFLEALNRKEKEAGWIYRMPYADEWEYACRGGPPGPASVKLDYAFDFYLDKPTNQLLPEQANFNKVLNRTCKVGSYPPNRLGLHDMHGNVMELCNNESGLHKGGSFEFTSDGCRATWRGAFAGSHRHHALGLRLARVPVAKEGE